MRLSVSVVLALLGAGLGSTVAAQDLPAFVQELIAKQETTPMRSFVRIWRYEYKGETVFFVPQSPLLSDSTSQLYSSAGELICKPDGGYFGIGDGRCSDFFQSRTMGRLVWSDTRFQPRPESARVETDQSASQSASKSDPRE